MCVCVYFCHPNKSWQLSFRLSLSLTHLCLRKTFLLPPCVLAYPLPATQQQISSLLLIFASSSKTEEMATFMAFYNLTHFFTTLKLSILRCAHPLCFTYSLPLFLALFAADGKQFNIHIIQCHLKVLKKMGEFLTFSSPSSPHLTYTHALTCTHLISSPCFYYFWFFTHSLSSYIIHLYRVEEKR